MSLWMGKSPLDSSILVLLTRALCVFVQPVRKTETPVTPNHGHERVLTAETPLQQSLPATPCQQRHGPSGRRSLRPLHQGSGRQPPGPGSRLRWARHPAAGRAKRQSPRPRLTPRVEPTASAVPPAQGPAAFPAPGSCWIQTPPAPALAPTPFSSRQRGAWSPPPPAPAQRRARRPPAHPPPPPGTHREPAEKGRGTGAGPRHNTGPTPPHSARPPAFPASLPPSAGGPRAGRAGTLSPYRPPRGSNARRRDYSSQQAKRRGRGGKREASAPPRTASLLCVLGVVVARLSPGGGHFASRGVGACRKTGPSAPLCRRGDGGTTAPRVHRAGSAPAILPPVRRGVGRGGAWGSLLRPGEPAAVSVGSAAAVAEARQPPLGLPAP